MKFGNPSGSWATWGLGALALAFIGTSAIATDRTERFSRLPNWRGQWETIGVSLDANGGIHESLEDVLAEMKKWGDPPYREDVRPIFQAIANEGRQLSKAVESGGPDPTLSKPTCAFGFPMLMIESPLMFEVLTTPEETAMIFSGREIRHIYTDGRPHTPSDELWPTPWGDSIGHWEGQTLVIDTISLEMPSDMGGLPPMVYAWGGNNSGQFDIVAMFSRNARFEERIRMLDADRLEDQMTIVDPKVFTKTWTITRRYRRVKRVNHLVHEDCEGEDRNPIVGGRYTLAEPPHQPPALPPPFQ
jgi:hypothetical protein